MAADYEFSERVKTIAEQLIPTHHAHLAKAKIAYMMKKKKENSKGPSAPKKPGKHVAMAKARSMNSLMWSISGFDFVLEVIEEWWNVLEIDQQIALVDHELCHMTEHEGEFYVRDHDVEEFVSIVQRHGPWHGRIAAFLEAGQMDLPFDEASAKAAQAAETVQ